MSKYTYYEDQLNRIDFRNNYHATVKFRDQNGETNFIDVNENSAKAIINKLVREFNVIPNSHISQMDINQMWVAFGNFCRAMNDQMKGT